MGLINCNDLWASQIEADYFVAYFNAAKHIFMQPARFNNFVRNRYGNDES